MHKTAYDKTNASSKIIGCKRFNRSPLGRSVCSASLPQTPGKARVYTNADLDVFRRIKEFTASGKTLAQIDDLLLYAPEDDAGNSTGLIPWADAIKSIETQRAIMAQLQSQIDAQNQRLAMLENWLALPWYKRIGKTPPTNH